MLKEFTGQDVRDAYERISNFVRRTPLEDSVYLSNDERRYRFKLESQQICKTFKVRGVLNALMQLPEEQVERGVGCISTGNHAIAVSYVAKLLGIKNCVVVVPAGTPRSKLDRISYYGARTMTMGTTFAEAQTLGTNYLDCNELFLVDAADYDPHIYAGHGTVGLEILTMHPKIDTIVVPVGRGCLITGVAVGARSVRPDVRIVGVQTAACPAVMRSFEEGVCHTSYPTVGETICDAVIGGVGRLAYQMLPGLVDEMIVVEESEIRDALRFMVAEEQFTVEGASAMVIAAVREHPELVGGTNVALVISGGNADGKVIGRVLHDAGL